MSKHHRTPEWHRNSKIVRQVTKATLSRGGQVRCVNCGKTIAPDQAWDVGHIVDADRGGSSALSNLGAAHRRCNRSAGGRLGAIKTNATSRRARRLPTGWSAA